MSFDGSWFFNTDESEKPGKGAHERMINRSCIAAWGDCRGKGAEELLKLPAAGESVFLFRVGFGIIATATFDNQDPFPSRTVFNEQGEYHRKVCNLLILPETEILSYSHILENTGYNIPARKILCKIHHSAAVKFMLDYFKGHAIEVTDFL